MFYIFAIFSILTLYVAGILTIALFKTKTKDERELAEWSQKQRNPFLCIFFGALGLALFPFLILDFFVDMPHTGYYDGRDR